MLRLRRLESRPGNPVANPGAFLYNRLIVMKAAPLRQTLPQRVCRRERQSAMEFNSFSFLIFFPIVLAVYFVIPRKLRYLWLLAASYYFYMSWNPVYVLLLVFSTAATWLGGLAVDRLRREEKRGLAKLVLFAVLAANLGLLAYFKYANFLLDSLRRALELLHRSGRLPVVEVLLPVGISFYTFQAIGYTLDVFRGRLEPEKNPLRYALFVSFFPQLVAGPIERATNLLPQLRAVDELELWDWPRIQRGCLRMLGGFFMKMVIADRAAIAVNAVFSQLEYCPPSTYAAAILLFTVQIYCDFGGYSSIAIGAAEIMGVRLMENFRAPYLARSIRDFWSRWHISLSTWFMDYLYIPLGGNRRGKARKYLNLLIVFAVSGLWHGAAWHFVAWGLLHAGMRICGEITDPWRKAARARLGIREEAPLLKLAQILGTFLLASVAWLFFRAQSLSEALFMLRALFTPWDLGSLWYEGSSMGMRAEEMILLLVSIALLLVSDILREKRFCFADRFEKWALPLRALFFLLGILVILTFGVYGPNYAVSDFIYFQF